MMVPVNTNRWIAWIVAACLMTALALRVIFFCISISRLPVSSDETLSMMQGKDIRRGEWPLLIKGNPYQFPLESYLNAPVVYELPRTAFGVRMVPAIEGLLASILFLAPFFLLGQLRETWPGILLALFPPAYLLMLQSAYFIPEHTSIELLCAGSVILALWRPSGTKKMFLAAFGGGLLAGLAFSTHMVSLSVSIMVMATILLRGAWRPSLFAGSACAVGLLCGMAPYLAAKWWIPHSYEAVSSLRSWHQIVHSLRSPSLDHALQSGLGLSPCIYPDWKQTLPEIRFLNHVPMLIWLATFLAVTVLRGAGFCRRTLNSRCVSLRPNDLFIGISWLALIFFYFSIHSDAYTIRFLLPLLWSFPFLWSYLYSRSRKTWRKVMATLTVMLIILNLFGGVRLMRFWAHYPFSEKETPFLDLKPVLRYLEYKNITRCYAPAWTAYRINFMTDERVLAVEPFNYRFPNWPIPYRDKVSSSTNIAFVLDPHIMLTTRKFNEDLVFEHVTCQRQTRGGFTVYTDFHENRPWKEERIPFSQVRVMTSHNPKDAQSLSDGNRLHGWHSIEHQTTGMRTEFHWPAKLPLTRISLYYTDSRLESATTLNISLHTSEGWRTLTNNLPMTLERFTILCGHPEYGQHTQNIRFPPTQADGVRLEIAQTRPLCDWIIREVEFYSANTNRDGVAGLPDADQ